MSVTVFTQPVAEPVTLEEVCEHVRVTNNDSDTYLQPLISAARRYVETFTRRALINQTLDFWTDSVPSGDTLALPRPPLQSVTSVTSYDSSDVGTVFSSTNYRVEAENHETGRVVLKSTADWPSNTRDWHGLNVRFVAGYGTDPENVPEPIRHAIKLLVAHWFENREPVNIGNIVSDIPLMVHHLIYPFKVILL
jgi:uncharacterized phiE125 gp8 family phage protein